MIFWVFHNTILYLQIYPANSKIFGQQSQGFLGNQQTTTKRKNSQLQVTSMYTYFLSIVTLTQELSLNSVMLMISSIARGSALQFN